MLPLERLKGLGPKRIAELKKMDINSAEDLLEFLPRSYKNMSNLKDIASILDGEQVAVIVRFASPPSVMRARKKLSIVRASVFDASGWANCVWFNQVYLANIIKMDTQYLIFGQAQLERGRIKFVNPICEKYDPESGYDKIVPIYPVKKTIPQKLIRQSIKEALILFGGSQKDFLSEGFRKRFNLCERNFAVYNIHFPIDEVSLEKAQRRLAFEQLLIFQYSISLYKEQNKKTKLQSLKITEEDKQRFISMLPFPLTGAQKRTIEEVTRDMRSNLAMNRLIQGDVGSGKTVIALYAMYCAYLNGRQSVLMVPTEVLAGQHMKAVCDIFAPLGINAVLLTGGMRKEARRQALEAIADGNVSMVIGTHAVFSPDVVFRDLAVVITDEQHRFGVRQRAAISAKGSVPDVLVMSATPIPRTLALILYGDLDISVIDELPPGRKRVKTFIIPEHKRRDMYGYLAKRIDEGRQGYFICPLVDSSEDSESVSAEELYEELKTGPFARYRVGLVHGKLSNREKMSVMNEFAKGNIDLLVSTTVIEVGINVPNAVFIIIEDAARFGLAQLHQLRGRVGRGEHESFCFMMVDDNDNKVRERLTVMTQTQNGFVIAEKDLELRGPGDFLGTRQHGLPDIKLASYLKDMSLVRETKEAIEQLESAPEFYADR
ncbi:MAG TPA: ATP-dependent DNA helicase RecG, partial [Clostridia bacterium]|nr:ATP-dependent DNA helicase RecG [Clostridia bacterium]